VRRGRGFEYRDPDGERIDDPEVLERIAELAVPPAWSEVWICMDPLGHLQATGVDAASRKQYLYHERWRAHRDRVKFDAMSTFGAALPRLRRRVARELRREQPGTRASPDELTRARVLACAVRLLDLGFFRIGSEGYAEKNESYGLTTMLREHVTVAGDELIFDFPAKSSQRRVQAIADEDVRALVAALKRRRSGSQLLAYRVEDGWTEVQAEERVGAVSCRPCERRAYGVPGGTRACGPGLDQDGRGVSRQHACRLPRVVRGSAHRRPVHVRSVDRRCARQARRRRP